ncbi:DUF479 domain-containing protein [Vibrio aquaticus]|uniref:DUF479 domain-containing protein n=1 Tax=Vibrio aquaticus TaxID=2496559 RepID=A0A3S0MKW8_9VIBR|nr:ACP phosphodiesterase [Vibrio aquaticus]RTZ17417.1 DUF479 domain-containing protein [Vibrio aquaticus]
MNYLAHLHIADHCQSSPLGNLLGDFVKGDPQRQFPKVVADGIQLHRFVDSFTDSHQAVLDSKSLFPQGVRRFSGIALDMFWDHCLSKRWGEFHHDELPLFCLNAQKRVIAQSRFPLPDRFVQMSFAMWQGQWLESYQHLDNIEFALNRMSQRRATMGVLAECFPYLETNYHQLNEVFSTFYPEILTAAKRF